MIRSFRDVGTEHLFHGVNSKEARGCLPRSLWTVACRKLDRLNRATELRDLKDPPANRLEALHGDFAGRYSLRINDQYRLVFCFADGDATDVAIVDYH